MICNNCGGRERPFEYGLCWRCSMEMEHESDKDNYTLDRRITAKESEIELILTLGKRIHL